ncbi:ubiquitin-conjugating enzyme E2, putative [Plasmodium ovale curtisi]|uniref:Ubiquitin-conjugating enzyme E2, putative n=1 Tax=Plasmodium ovale curtisi TaxID=864141 RepID=A0A1A8W1N1_PLAOA|nr:ubiquitin-conjugating enzyme E2, putative [Plasmodium ovale curtisi]SBS95417.1 ubiquitin-conjugating enzyme E2, putative [Plasmodium ovale curtisi]
MTKNRLLIESREAKRQSDPDIILTHRYVAANWMKNLLGKILSKIQSFRCYVLFLVGCVFLVKPQHLFVLLSDVVAYFCFCAMSRPSSRERRSLAQVLHVFAHRSVHVCSSFKPRKVSMLDRHCSYGNMDTVFRELVYIEYNLYEWQAIIRGPKDSPYEGGHWKLSIKCKSTYPIDPPLITFMTKFFHPNVNFVTGTYYVTCELFPLEYMSTRGCIDREHSTNA